MDADDTRTARARESIIAGIVIQGFTGGPELKLDSASTRDSNLCPATGEDRETSRSGAVADGSIANVLGGLNA